MGSYMSILQTAVGRDSSSPATYTRRSRGTSDQEIVNLTKTQDLREISWPL